MASLPSSADARLFVEAAPSKVAEDLLQTLSIAIEYVPIKKLKLYGRHARTHPKRQIEQIAESIRAFGFVSPLFVSLLIVDAEGELIAGHGRLAAAKHLGYTEVPVVRIEHLDDAQKEMLEAGRTAGLELKNLAVWNKGVGGMGSLLRSQHELVFMFKEPSAPHINNVQLGKFGRNRTNVWDYPGAASLREELELHPTPKPVALVADAIRDVSNRNDIVLDAFSGSGTAIIAAASTGRRARVIELDPHYSMSRSCAGRSGRARRPCTSRATSALPNFGEQRAEGPADAPADAAATSADVRVRKRTRAAA